MKLEINNVTKKFRDKTAVYPFSLEINKGECVGLIGPNGAGKSTLIKIIADILVPTEGEVLLNNKKMSSMKREIGYLPQYPNFYPWMTAIETLEFMGGLSGIKKMELTKRIPIILEQVRLSDEMNSRVGAFSGGMKQRLGIAQALLHKPSFIVMDEPVSALDPIGRREVLNLINEIKNETTILLSTHILGDAEEICERFVVIKNGRKIEDTSLEDLLNKNQIIGMKLTQMDQDWLRAIKHMDFVKRVEVKGNDIKLEVDDIQRDKSRLLESALLHKVDLMKFEVNANRLEEIFLKLVVDK